MPYPLSTEVAVCFRNNLYPQKLSKDLWREYVTPIATTTGISLADVFLFDKYISHASDFTYQLRFLFYYLTLLKSPSFRHPSLRLYVHQNPKPAFEYAIGFMSG